MGDEDFNGFQPDGLPDVTVYVAKDRCKVGMAHLRSAIEDHSSKRAAALQDFLVPLGTLEDEEEDERAAFLTRRLALQLLNDLCKAGNQTSAREEVMLQWGFGCAGEIEASLNAAIARDRTGKLQELKDEWLRRLMKGT